MPQQKMPMKSKKKVEIPDKKVVANKSNSKDSKGSGTGSSNKVTTNAQQQQQQSKLPAKLPQQPPVNPQKNSINNANTAKLLNQQIISSKPQNPPPLIKPQLQMPTSTTGPIKNINVFNDDEPI